MGIVTKSGDKGRTSLYRGKRVGKDHLRIEICGGLDELSSYLGTAKNLIKDLSVRKIIESLQKDLFLVGAEVVCEKEAAMKLKRRIGSHQVKVIEKQIKELEKKKITLKKGFVIPGRTLYSGLLDVSRALTRRIERRVVALARKQNINNANLLVYLNRISDLLYLLARLKI